MIPILMEEMRLGDNGYERSRLFIRYVSAGSYAELLRKVEAIDGTIRVGNEKFRVKRSHQEKVPLRFDDTSSEEGKMWHQMLEGIVDNINRLNEFCKRRAIANAGKRLHR